MISNLLAAIRDNKSSQLVQGIPAEGSDRKQEPKGGFGLILKALQGEATDADGKNQQPLPQTLSGQNELPDGEATPKEAETGKQENTVHVPPIKTVPKGQTKTDETPKTPEPESETVQKGEEKKVQVQTDQKLPKQAEDAGEQKNSNTDAAQKEGWKNDGEKQINVKSKPDISSTGGFSHHETQDSDQPILSEREVPEGDTSIEGLTETQDPGNSPEKNGEIVTERSEPVSKTPVVDTEKIPDSHKTEVAPNPEQVKKPVHDLKFPEPNKPQGSAKERNPITVNREHSVAEKNPGRQNRGFANPTDVLKSPLQDGEKADVKQQVVIPASGNSRNIGTTFVHPEPNPEMTVVSDDPMKAVAESVKVEGRLESIPANFVENKPTGKINVASIGEIGTNEVSKKVTKAGVVIQPKPEISINQEGLRMVGHQKMDLVKRPVLMNVVPQRVQAPTPEPVFNSESISEENREKTGSDFFIHKDTTFPLRDGVMIKQMHVEDIREKKYGERFAKPENRAENLTEREKPVSDWRRFLPWTEKGSVFMNREFQANSSFSFQEFGGSEDELLWKKHTMDVSPLNDNKTSEPQNIGFSRLMEIPVINFSARRNLLPALTQTVQKATTGGNALSENWQKHNFTLENGKNLQLSMRQVDGVVYLKLNSTHSELTKLLMQHQNEIREHLQRECNLEVDLQFEGGGEQDLSQFFDDSSPSGKRGWSGKNILAGKKSFSENEPQNVQKTIRKFGYNRMEWMA